MPRTRDTNTYKIMHDRSRQFRRQSPGKTRGYGNKSSSAAIRHSRFPPLNCMPHKPHKPNFEGAVTLRRLTALHISKNHGERYSKVKEYLAYVPCQCTKDLAMWPKIYPSRVTFYAVNTLNVAQCTPRHSNVFNYVLINALY
jgi:hypothetical protein